MPKFVLLCKMSELKDMMEDEEYATDMVELGLGDKLTLAVDDTLNSVYKEFKNCEMQLDDGECMTWYGERGGGYRFFGVDVDVYRGPDGNLYCKEKHENAFMEF